MSHRVGLAASDWSFHMRRCMAQRLFYVVQTSPMRWLLGRHMRARMPAVALAAGEEFVAKPRRVLALSAHPDDLEFFAAGTLRRLCQSGGHVHAVILTDGEKRGNMPGCARVRRTEQMLAARLQGYASVHMYSLPDYGLPEDPRVEQVVAESFMKIMPEVVMAFDPQELVARFANRDHKALGRTVMDAARHWVRLGVRVYFYGTRQPNTLVNVTDVLYDKIQAMEAHQSQLIYLKRAEHRRAMELLNQAWASQSGVPYAEGLYRLI